MLDDDNGCCGDQYAPVSIERQKRQRSENMKVRFDPAATQVDEQGGSQHLTDGDHMSG